ncbi:phenylacetate-CoA ligase [Marinobacter sp. es.042]|uniref:phenylacetate--CoA ligase family protein n=1 Tax=Marinobacter sp. es.042 TaxID=1761794 RepID=UPI000B50E390|nr:phenylacetate--CoA ligase family protein [Marinobacter sp. es.042]SNB55492.1 phenylacetate-CoA ligase [Marinobacter sp. es.042]
MHKRLAKQLFELGAKARNPSLFGLYDALKETEWLNRKQLQDFQNEKARMFLSFASENSPFYKQLFQKIGFRPDKYTGIKDLACIPEIDKLCLIENNASIHSQNISEKVRLAETSGTSGQSLSFNRAESWDSQNRAAMMRAYDWYEVKPWDRNGYLWGYNISRRQHLKVKFLDILQNRFRIFDYSEKEIDGFARRLCSAQFLNGYSSMVYEVARLINERGIDIPNLKLVKGTSEIILDIHHAESIKAFGRRVTSEYGAAEAGLIAFECPYGGLHINVETVILEQNSAGEALVTNLASHSFPIIRYNLGDIISFSDDYCLCGRSHPLLKDVKGRKGKNVVGFKRKYPGLTFYYVFKNIALENSVLINYKVVQREVGKVVVLIEGLRSAKTVGLVQEQLDRYFGSDVEFEIEFVEKFGLELKKRQYFESDF